MSSTPSPPMSAHLSRTEHVCGYILPNGETCTKSYPRAGNLKRHMTTSHPLSETQSITFVHHFAGHHGLAPAVRESSRLTPASTTPPPLMKGLLATTSSELIDGPSFMVHEKSIPTAPSTCPSNAPLLSGPRLSPQLSSTIFSTPNYEDLGQAHTDPSQSSANASEVSWPNMYPTHYDSFPSAFPPYVGGSSSYRDVMTDPGPSRTTRRRSSLKSTVNFENSRKRRRSSLGTGRAIESSFKKPMPRYEVKQSKKIPNQQRALDWLTFSAKSAFDETMRSILSQWGLRHGHQGTCVLYPEDWKTADPSELLPKLNNHNYPSSASRRAWYHHADHATSFARAAVWFAQWPRTGVEHDNFLGCGDFKPMDASHLCHHDHCIIHLVYEGSDVNQSRKYCCKRARFLRQEGRAVPHHCDQHQPPYLIQHAALTTLETYYIQFHILRQAKGLPPVTIPRPRQYLYPTLESRLPCNFEAVHVDATDLVSEALPVTREGKPSLFCVFCERLKAFTSVNGLWAHLIHKHEDIDTGERLREIERTGALWEDYWAKYSDGGKRGNNTSARLQQLKQEEFCWEDVLDWNIR